ncbi:MAG: hypothetical protein ABJF50_01575 [Paracoccaceae bacterium]
MSHVIAATDTNAQNQRIFMQLGLFGILLVGLIAVADVSPAYGSCSGVAALSGPLLPVVA